MSNTTREAYCEIIVRRDLPSDVAYIPLTFAPDLCVGDLFDMLLPMLSIYQEYVRNHHYSLQVLAEYKQKHEFNALLKRYEEKPACEGRTLETFLTYPMHQVNDSAPDILPFFLSFFLFFVCFVS